jgi:hypothetical protein
MQWLTSKFWDSGTAQWLRALSAPGEDSLQVVRIKLGAAILTTVSVLALNMILASTP